MSYLVLARKWRPQNFDEILGQEAIVKTLKNAILQDRVAHAFLFSGPRGVGKTSLARVLAKALNCQAGPQPTISPCGQCASCLEIAAGSAVDVLEIDGASNTSVDNIRDLRETVRYLPAASRTKIYIIDEVHMLSISAFNALLKTLEEPPPHVAFIFATTEAHKVPPTILSRCQRYDFHRTGLEVLVGHLKKICAAEKISLPESALRVIAREAEGSVRDSLSLLDQVTSFGTEGLTESEVLQIVGVVDQTLISGVLKAVLAGEAAPALDLIAAADAAGHDIKQLARELLRWLRNLVVVKLAADPGRLMDVSESELAELKELAGDKTLETLERLFDQLARLEEELGRSGQPRPLLEITLCKMATAPPVVPVEELIAKMEELEQRLKFAAFNHAEAGGAAGADATLFNRSREAGPSSEPPGPAPVSCRGDAAGWQEFLHFVENKDGKLYALLSAGKFAGHSGHEWRIAYPPQYPLRARLESKDNAASLHELLAACFGEGQRLIIVDDESLSPSPERPSRYQVDEQKRRNAVKDPLVQALIDQLGGEIEEIKVKN